MISECFKSIVNHLGEELPELRFCGAYNNAVKKQGSKVIHSPAVLLEFQDVQWKTIGSGYVQEGEAVIRLWIFQKVFASEEFGSPNQDKSLEQYHLLERVHGKLSGFSGSTFSSLERITTSFDFDFDQFRVHTMDYRTRLTDTSSCPPDAELAEPLTLQVSGETDLWPADASQ